MTTKQILIIILLLALPPQLTLVGDKLLDDWRAAIGLASHKVNQQEETLRVFAWMNKSTPADAIFLSPSREAHRIMAFADRKVIASGKVYPSESTELASRLRDLSTFFFTTDPEKAKEIASKYQASYIFLPRQPQYFDFCEPAAACHWVTYREPKKLTPDGQKKTIIGQLLSEVPNPDYRLVWSSRSFLIYRVTDASPPAPCEISDEEKMAALRFARSLFEGRFEAMPQSPIFTNSCAVQVSLWKEGSRVAAKLAQKSSFGKSLEVGARWLHDEISPKGQPATLANIHLQIELWDKGQKVIETSKILNEKTIDPRRGYVFSNGHQEAYITPTTLLSSAFRGSSDILRTLCLQPGNTDFCADIDRVTLESFPLTVWSDYNRNGKFGALIGLTSYDSNPTKENRTQIMQRTIRALDAIAKDEFTGVLSKYHTVSQQYVAAWALAEGFQRFRNTQYLFAARSITNRSEGNLQQSADNAIVAPALFAYSHLWQARRLPRDRLIAARLAQQLSNSLKDVPGTTENANLMFAALSAYVEATGEKTMRPLLNEWSATLVDRFQETRTLAAFTPSMSVPVTMGAWLASGLSTGSLDNKQARALGKWLLESQLGQDGYRGAFAEDGNRQYPSIVATAIAALSLADVIASGDGDGDWVPELTEALKDALQWLSLLQYDEVSPLFVHPNERTRLDGSIRTGLMSARISHEITAYFALTGMRYLQ